METLGLFVISVLAWFALELYYVLTGRATISERIRLLYQRWPSLGMLAGVVVGLLMGHFFFQ